MKRIAVFLISLVFCIGCITFAYGETGMSREEIFKKIEESGEFAKTVRWGDYLTVLCRDGRTIKYTYLGNVWIEIDLDVFEESDIEIKDDTVFDINDIAVYGDQIFAGCNDGLVIIISSCPKCYKLKQVCDFDIKKIDFGTEGFIFKGSSPEQEETAAYNVLRQDKIDPDVAAGLAAGGAVLVDVRDRADYEAGHIYGAVSIPIDEIDKIGEYPQNSTLIFYCYSGTRAGKAVEQARSMGFINVYNAGGYEDFY